MKRKIILTGDGSRTIFLPEWNENYHSKHGAIQEAYHVFINYGLQYFIDKHKELSKVSILEIGFGTGLNAFITLLESQEKGINVDYVGVEAYPISDYEVSLLNYSETLSSDTDLFNKVHECVWESKNQLLDNFSITKRQQFFHQIEDRNKYDLIYFDAFGARVQPELWTEEIFKKMYNALKKNGVLVTYSAKGSVRRAMQNVGFNVEKLPGPPGKREMLRAIKIA